MIIIHVVVSFALILIVLLQTGKGAEMGAGFGGGSNQTIFGSRGAATFLSKITTGAAVMFMLTSLSLAIMTKNRTNSVIRDSAPRAAAPAAPAAVPSAPPATPASPAPTHATPEAPAAK
ncbi:MAG: preprotein translocase subunit SecG [Candidatus Methylomirabilia bacterium]